MEIHPQRQIKKAILGQPLFLIILFYHIDYDAGKEQSDECFNSLVESLNKFQETYGFEKNSWQIDWMEMFELKIKFVDKN
jgi:hypothetical protein